MQCRSHGGEWAMSPTIDRIFYAIISINNHRGGIFKFYFASPPRNSKILGTPLKHGINCDMKKIVLQFQQLPQKGYLTTTDTFIQRQQEQRKHATTATARTGGNLGCLRVPFSSRGVGGNQGRVGDRVRARTSGYV
jgi:hypothetical protein